MEKGSAESHYVCVGYERRLVEQEEHTDCALLLTPPVTYATVK